jgi:hypothetical protein
MNSNVNAEPTGGAQRLDQVTGSHAVPEADCRARWCRQLEIVNGKDLPSTGPSGRREQHGWYWFE